MARKLNLSTILKHLDLKNLEVYSTVQKNEEDRKELDRMLSYILPLWVSGALDAKDQIHLLVRFNRHINESWWELEGHPELRAKVLAAIGPGHQIRHAYQVRPRIKATALSDMLTRLYPDIRKDEIQIWCSKNSEAELLELCSGLGIQEKECEIIVTEYRNIVS